LSPSSAGAIDPPTSTVAVGGARVPPWHLRTGTEIQQQKSPRTLPEPDDDPIYAEIFEPGLSPLKKKKQKKKAKHFYSAPTANPLAADPPTVSTRSSTSE
jgi:hypothetical protein